MTTTTSTKANHHNVTVGETLVRFEGDAETAVVESLVRNGAYDVITITVRGGRNVITVSARKGGSKDSLLVLA